MRTLAEEIFVWRADIDGRVDLEVDKILKNVNFNNK
jgi:hypothetical protein